MTREILGNWQQIYLKIGKINTYFLYVHLRRLGAITLVEMTQELDRRNISKLQKTYFEVYQSNTIPYILHVLLRPSDSTKQVGIRCTGAFYQLWGDEILKNEK